MKSISFPNGHMLVKFERISDNVTYKTGADGQTIISFSADKSGKCTIKLQATSPSNAYLMGLANLQGGGPMTFVPVQVSWQDIYRKDVASGVPGCIVKIPDFVRGMDNTGNDMEWVFFLERYDLLLGNPAFVGLATASAEAAGG